MNRDSFLFNIVKISLVLFVATIISLYVSYHFFQKNLTDISPLIQVYIAISVSFLTLLLQRRISYTNSLRSLYEKIVETVQDTLSYTKSSSKTEDEYKKILTKISCRIDDTRGVFRNIDELYVEPTSESKIFTDSIRKSLNLDSVKNVCDSFSANQKKHRKLIKGLYPYESLKQMHHIVQMLGSGSGVSERNCTIAREAINLLWGNLRSELLKELDRDFPKFPDTPYKSEKRKGDYWGLLENLKFRFERMISIKNWHRDILSCLNKLYHRRGKKNKDTSSI